MVRLWNVEIVRWRDGKMVKWWDGEIVKLWDGAMQHKITLKTKSYWKSKWAHFNFINFLRNSLLFLPSLSRNKIPLHLNFVLSRKLNCLCITSHLSIWPKGCDGSFLILIAHFWYWGRMEDLDTVEVRPLGCFSWHEKAPEAIFVS